METAFHQLNVAFIYACDHKAHTSTVVTLADLLRNMIGCRVTMATSESTYETVSVSSADRVQDVHAQNDDVDLFCFVHSEWAYKLVVVSQSGDASLSNIANKDDCDFLKIFHEISQNSEYQAKSVSLKFEYTPDSYVIREPFLGPLFNIPTNIDALVKHFHRRLDIPIDKPVEISSDSLVGLVTAINGTFAYQTSHKLWLSTKLFYLRNAPSSDDSGVVINRRKRSRTKSVRSRSAETVTCHTNGCVSKHSRQVCAMCEFRNGSRVRANSCNLSFYPPDSEYDDTSIGFSLLETKLVDVNDRYAYIVNNKLATDDEYYTLDGHSV